MDEMLQMLASVGLENLSPAQLASVLGPEEMATLEQMEGLRSLRAQAPPSNLSQGMREQDIESFIRGREQDIIHAHEVLERELKATPVPIRTLPRKMALRIMQDDINSYRPASKDCPHYRQTYDDGRRRFSSQPLSKLKQISISQLSVPCHHEGKYLFCRVVSSIKQMVACLFMVDDPSGDCIAVGAYHFVPNLSLFGPSLDSQLPMGTKIAIREPYIKVSGGDGGQPFVRVDSPTDIVVLEDDDPHCKGVTWCYDWGLRRIQANKSAEIYKALGNTAFQRNDYYSALTAYEHALKAPRAREIRGALYSNISAACLHSSKPGRAYLSAKAALAANLTEPRLVAKALFRQGSAAYQLRCFNEAESLFKRGLTVAGGDKKAQGLAKEFNECLQRTSKRLRERDAGIYDFHAMFSDVIAGGPNPRLDVADFAGPVEIRSSPSGSRGLHVTRDVAAGELLFVSKAVSITSKNDAEIENVTMIAFDLVKNRLRDETQVLNTIKLIHLCIDNPASYSTVCALDGNLPSSPSQPPLGIVNTEKQVIEQLGVAVDVDVGRLERIAAFNSFADRPFQPYLNSGGPAEAGESSVYLERHKPTSLFYLSSFCNHSCFPTAKRAHFGDAMVVRALLPLSQGDEITLGYISPGMNFDERQKSLERFGFQCNCWYCREENMDGEAAHKRRNMMIDTELPKAMALVRQVTGNARDGNYDAVLFSAAFKAIENIKDKVEATYHPDRGRLRPDMYYIQRPLSDLREFKEIRKSIEDEKRALAALGAVIKGGRLIKKRKGSSSNPTVMMSQLPLLLNDDVVLSILTIAARHYMLGELDLQRDWVATAVWAHDVLIGGGLPVLKERCPEYFKCIL